QKLKSRLEQWTISFRGNATPLPQGDLNILQQRRAGRQLKITVTDPAHERWKNFRASAVSRKGRGP
ncbi:MAG: hypothetical protein P8J33_15830, partial [Pirellulaceae bacterium]|nr:hypothetical protein [Pirellulaceae bacterium]